MAVNSAEIITSIKEKYPAQEQILIRNCSDLDIGANKQLVNQYILGVTEDESFRGGGIGMYEYQIRQKLESITPNVICLPWPFEDYEIDKLRTVLHELATYFLININVDKMIEKLNIKMDNVHRYYIVITIAQYEIVSVQ